MPYATYGELVDDSERENSIKKEVDDYDFSQYDEADDQEIVSEE